MGKDQIIVMNLCGRGDKDIFTVGKILGQAHPPVGDDDGMECYSGNQVAGVGIPYEGRSMSVVPMAAVQIGECDPGALAE
jgi:hypothetical protein